MSSHKICHKIDSILSFFISRSDCEHGSDQVTILTKRFLDDQCFVKLCRKCTCPTYITI